MKNVCNVALLFLCCAMGVMGATKSDELMLIKALQAGANRGIIFLPALGLQGLQKGTAALSRSAASAYQSVEKYKKAQKNGVMETLAIAPAMCLSAVEKSAAKASELSEHANIFLEKFADSPIFNNFASQPAKIHALYYVSLATASLARSWLLYKTLPNKAKFLAIPDAIVGVATGIPAGIALATALKDALTDDKKA